MSGGPYDKDLITVYRMPADPGETDFAAASEADLVINPEGMVLVDRLCSIPLLDRGADLQALARAAAAAGRTAVDLGALRQRLGAERCAWMAGRPQVELSEE